jgi:hypothetical protein
MQDSTAALLLTAIEPTGTNIHFSDITNISRRFHMVLNHIHVARHAG